jgi:hypothetical protein
MLGDYGGLEPSGVGNECRVLGKGPGRLYCCERAQQNGKRLEATIPHSDALKTKVLAGAFSTVRTQQPCVFCLVAALPPVHPHGWRTCGATLRSIGRYAAPMTLRRLRGAGSG